jgi:hypothetical protein
MTGAPPTGTVLSDIADLVEVLVWPAVLVLLIWLLRKPILGLADRASREAQRVAVGGLEIDFGAAVEPVTQPGTTALTGLREPDPAFRISDSATASIMAELTAAQPAPHVVVDLGTGQEWLSSRLFIFAILLARMRGTRTLVFLETAEGVRGQFVGLASPSAVHWGLAATYSWLEADYAAAYSDATAWGRTPNAGRPVMLDASGRLTEEVVTVLVNGFLARVQSAPAPQAGTPVQPGWTTVARPSGVLHEHASWLGAGDVERLLGSALDTNAYIVQPPPHDPVEAARAALKFSGRDHIALVDGRHRFAGVLVNRRGALEEMAHALPATDAPAVDGGNGRVRTS